LIGDNTNDVVQSDNSINDDVVKNDNSVSDDLVKNDSSINQSQEIDESIDSENNPSTGPPIGWVEGSVVSDVSVDFTPKSLTQLTKFHPMDSENKCDYCLKFLSSFEDAKEAITNLLKADPRSVYRRTKCVDRLYYFTIDSLHITSWFDIETNVVEVVKIKPFISNK